MEFSMTKRMKKVGTMFCAVALLTTGCTTMHGGASDEEQIAQLFTQWKSAVDALDVDAMLAVYSDSYENSEGMDKEGLRSMISGAIDQGMMDDMDVIIEGAATTVTGNSAEVSGIVYEFSGGSIEVDFELNKEDGTWRIVGEQRV